MVCGQWLLAVHGSLMEPVKHPRRATSAKAFGTLANALPEDMLGDSAVDGPDQSPTVNEWLGHVSPMASVGNALYLS